MRILAFLALLAVIVSAITVEQGTVEEDEFSTEAPETTIGVSVQHMMPDNPFNST